MKLQILPNWCKKLGLILFFSFFVLTGFEEFRAGWYSVEDSSPYKPVNQTQAEYKPYKVSEIMNNIGIHYFEMLGIIGMLIYMLSKERIEDDYIHKLRYESYLFSSIFWLVIAIIAYSFNENLKLSIDYFIYLFIWTYLITFFIKKRIY
ncbi:hypothetical protein ACFQ5N_04270 [Lutibacter holmesii]|uniref:Uncharacterized protein n=1 Tax=Lutibacter holmesii TaxID=1137985 RepID=A0ABW3WP68_9FLAO